MEESALFATCANASPTAESLSLERLKAIVAHLHEQDPIAAWMRERGFDPARGCLLFVPETARAEFGPFPPHYVRFSRIATAATMVDVDALGLPKPILEEFPLILRRSRSAVITEVQYP